MEFPLTTSLENTISKEAYRLSFNCYKALHCYNVKGVLSTICRTPVSSRVLSWIGNKSHFFVLQILHLHFAVSFRRLLSSAKYSADAALILKFLRTSTVFETCSIRWPENEMSGLMRIGRSCREGSYHSPPSCLVQVTCDDRER